MKNSIKVLSILFLINACSFANSSTVTVPINSNPPGADVKIDGKYFGQTPVFATLNPGKNHKAEISKPGYGTTNIDMDTWYSLRNGDGPDGKRCMADAVPLVLPYMIVLLFAPEKCAEFKQSDYFVDLTGGKPMSFEGNSFQPNVQNQHDSNQQNQIYNTNQYGGTNHRNHQQ